MLLQACDGFNQPGPYHVVTQHDVPFALWTLIDAREEAARQSQGFLQGCIVSVLRWRRLQQVL